MPTATAYRAAHPTVYRTVSTSILLAGILLAGSVPAGSIAAQGDSGRRYTARRERVPDFGALVPEVVGEPVAPAAPRARLERVSAGVAWPRGLAWIDDELVVLARGRHRRSGGVAPGVADRCGSLFVVDPDVAEPVVAGEIASPRVRANARLLAAPVGAPFFLYDGRTDTLTDVTMDRPYCTLAFDEASRNLFICGFSGVDLPGGKFRKNATDSIHRFDLRSRSWHAVEMHDHTVVPRAQLGVVVSNAYYPHHDPAENPAPHGWLNGPDGAAVAGRYLYALGKDNHAIVRYDLAAVRDDPSSGPPDSEQVLGADVLLRHPRGAMKVSLFGPSAAEARGGYLYVGYRTASVVVRFPIDADGALAQPIAGEPVVGELIAVFEPWDPAKQRSANLIDLAFDRQGRLFVSCAQEARIWNVGVPDPARPFYGDDHSDRPTTAPPYVDLREHTGVKKGVGNILFDPEDRLYICAGNYDAGDDLAGAIYRAVPAR